MFKIGDKVKSIYFDDPKIYTIISIEGKKIIIYHRPSNTTGTLYTTALLTKVKYISNGGNV